MISRDTTSTTGAELPTSRVLLHAIVATVALLAIGSGAAVAETGNETVESTVIHEFDQSDVRLTNVEFTDDGALVSLEHTGRGSEPVSVSDGGFSGTGQFAMTTVRISGEETVEIPLRGDEAVTITTAQDGYRHEGRVGLLTILSSQPTVQIVQWAVVAGTIGPILALTLVVTSLRRKHENSYKELTSEERVRVEKDPVDGFVDKIKRFVAENKTLVLSFALLSAYGMAWWFGRAPGPLEMWLSLSDAMRVIVAGSVAALLLSLVPVYVLADRLWSPDTEFVLSADSRDVIERALGSDGGLSEMVDAIQNGEGGLDRDGDEIDTGNYGVAIYSGSPDRIAEMEIDGAATDSRAPGGNLHVVEAFDPATNKARGTWPGMADDVELIAERSMIDANREIYRDESDMLRNILGALPAIQMAADTGAARAVDKEMREMMAIDDSPVHGILARAASGTRFEGFYDKDGGETVEYQDPDEQDDDRDDQESSTEVEQ